MAAAALFATAGCGVMSPAADAPETTGAVEKPAEDGTWHFYAPGQPQPQNDPHAAGLVGDEPHIEEPDIEPHREPAAEGPHLLPPRPQCPDTVQRGSIQGLEAVPAADSISLAWPTAAPDVQHYLVTAIPQRRGIDQPKQVWTQIPAVADCGEVTTVLDGLRPDSYYMVILRMVTTTTVADQTRDTVIRRSLVRTIR